MNLQAYFANGYYTGTLDEIFKDKDLFENNVMAMKQSFENKDSKVWRYNHTISNDQSIASFISIDEIAERKRLVEKNQYSVFQQLYTGPPPEHSRKYFQKCIESFIEPIYPLDKPFYYHHNDNLNVMVSGDHINNHVDGGNPERICGFIIYLSNYSDYIEKSGGGELILNNDIVVMPVKGTFVLLDYTKHNIKHEVKLVKNDFIRMAYVNFITIQQFN